MRDPSERTEEAARASAAACVLVVEDDPAVRRLVHSMLKVRGYRVLEAANGGEALAQLNRHGREIELIVSDVVMPDVNGPELAARAASLGHAVPVLFMSGYAERTLETRGLSDGTLRVLRKPFTFAELSARVEELLPQGER